MANSPQVYVLLGDGGLSKINQLSSAKWSTRVKRGKRSYENAVFEAYDSQNSQDVIVIAGRWSDNPDWDIRLRILRSRVVEINVKNSLVAFETGDWTSVTNGFQQISDIKNNIPKNQPRVLQNFAKWVIEE